LIGYLGLTLPLMPLQAVAAARGWQLAEALPLFYHRHAAAILGFRLDIRGRPSGDRPTLFVTNHMSYADIEIFGSVLRGSFIAKNEVRGWPLFGTLAKLQRTVFVDRRVRSSADQRDSLTQRLQQGGNLILFPEGTTSDGQCVLPFKSALFAAAEVECQGRKVTVQPVGIAYTRLNGVPLGRDMRPFLAWYGDMTMFGHLWAMAGLGVVDVVVQFYPPVTIEKFGSRKKLAEHCRQVIAEGVAAANAGRLPPPEPASAPVTIEAPIGAAPATMPR
jgi:1-acyl-sn-glycerol-3-phosphate acyltransferase